MWNKSISLSSNVDLYSSLFLNCYFVVKFEHECVQKTCQKVNRTLISLQKKNLCGHFPPTTEVWWEHNIMSACMDYLGQNNNNKKQDKTPKILWKINADNIFQTFNFAYDGHQSRCSRGTVYNVYSRMNAVLSCIHFRPAFLVLNEMKKIIALTATRQ